MSVADPGEGPIAQNDWTSLIIHDRRSGKFECTSALNKLQIREEWAIFGPPALIKLPWRDFVSSKMTEPRTEYQK